MTLADALVTMLWRNAVAAIPLALLVVVFCRMVRCRPSTRHALWLLVLGSLLLPPVIPSSWRESALASAGAHIGSASQSMGKLTASGWMQVTHLAGAAYSQFREKELPQSVDASPVLCLDDSKKQAAAAVNAADACASNQSSQSADRIASALTAGPVVQPQQAHSFETRSAAAAIKSPSGVAERSTIARANPLTSQSVSQNSAGAQWMMPSNKSSLSSPVARPRTTLPASQLDGVGSAYGMSSPKRNLNSPMASVAPPPQQSFSKIEQLSKDAPQPMATPAPVQEHAGVREINPRSPALEMEKPVPAAPTAATSTPKSSIVDDARQSLQPWVESVVSVRNAILQIPPIPTAFWFGGMVVLLILAVLRIWRFHAVLRRSVPAQGEIVAMVNNAAAQLKLRRVPMTVVTDRSLPPMIWCGWPMKLILPAALWRDLDNVGRRAVIMHELAHLKRRDHWVCWVSAAIGLVYWWHPVVWWCRRRLREEADFCCDNWVTALLPKARRAYAQALLTARTSMNETGSPMPAVGLGTSTPKAKRFARRLTMVMTNQTGPRMSRWGFAGVALLGATAWLAAPLWACPPESSEGGQAAKAKVKVRAPVAVTTPSAVMVAPRVATPAPLRGVVIESGQAPAAAGDASTFERYMAARAPQQGVAMAGPAQGGVDSRLDALERRLDALTEQLHQLLRGGQNMAPRSTGGGGMGGGTPAPMAMAAPSMRRSADAYRELAERDASLFGALRRGPDSGEVIDRVYKLPDGKLEAFTELMARQDVPILIERQDGAILVHATARQHEIVAAFIAIIDPDGDRGPAGGAFKSFQPGVQWRAEKELYGAQMQQGAQMKRMAEQQAAMAKRMAAGAQQRALIESSRARSQSFRKQAEEVRQQAEKMRRQSEDVRRKAEEAREKSSKVDDDDKRQRELDAQADAIEREADQIEVAADHLDEQADTLDEKADTADQQASEVEEALASADDEAAEMDAEMAELEADIDAEAAEDSDELMVAPDVPELPPVMEVPSLPPMPPMPAIPPMDVAPPSPAMMPMPPAPPAMAVPPAPPAHSAPPALPTTPVPPAPRGNPM